MKPGPVGARVRLGLSAVLVLLSVIGAAALGLALGSRALALGEVVAALTGRGVGDASIIVLDQRLPRTLLGLLVGAALGVGGAVAQSLTRNPLADPGLLGVSAGAALAIVCGAFVFGITTLAPQLLLAVGGATAAGCLVLLLGSRAAVARTPQGLALIGVALSAVLGSVASTVVLVDAQTLDEYRFWLVGSLAGRGSATLTTVAPPIAVGAVLSLLSCRSLDALALGEDSAQALGVRLRRARLTAGAAVVVLTGAAVAAAGPLAFIGLAVPHAARALSGARTAWLLGFSAGLGAALLVVADVVGRVVVRPNELPAGVVTALVGAPLALALLRRARSGGQV
ncbi:MAG: iron ABC transporter permease [Actinobacteria bacterium]|nr:iron ABC transporter permease [Actinomycetota bacterium]MBW3646153.1 iron ABC transporter permease [Actinomycetota bacterium]